MSAAPRVERGGLSALRRILEASGSRKILLLTGPSARHADRVVELLSGFEVHRFSGARRHVPREVLERARSTLRACGADALVAVGGGSAIGLGKALCLERTLPFIAVPTTYAGSELTDIYGITEEGRKTTGRDPSVRPTAVIYDVELTLGMPRALSIASLMNALAHPLAALGSENPPDSKEQALDAIVAVFGAIEALLRDTTDREARILALESAGLAARVLESAKPGTHHTLAHRLGGELDLEHGPLHAVLLPHSVHELRRSAPEALERVEQRLGIRDLESHLFDFLVRAGAATSLAGLGVALPDFEAFLHRHPELPPEPLRAAYSGHRPTVHAQHES